MNILFQGDSITDAGRNREMTIPNAFLGDGYVTMIAGMLTHERNDINVINKGFSGNRTEQIAARWQEDTLDIDYDVLSLLCGVNDVGFDIRKGIRGDRAFVEPILDKMLYQAREKNPDAKIILMTPFVFKMHYNHPEFGDDIYENYDLWRSRVETSGEIIKEASKKYNTEFIPLFDIFNDLVTKNNPERYTLDCIHLAAPGNAVIAHEWMKTFNKLNL